MSGSRYFKPPALPVVTDFVSFNILKSFLPDRPVPTRIWRGPFRGARIVMKPRDSLRKAFGLYEHELNPWLEQALRRVTRVLDVGANDGYFTFGCAAAFRRFGSPAEIIAFEPQARHVEQLRESVVAQSHSDVRIQVIQTMIGSRVQDGMTTLDALPSDDRSNTLIKIDVEGAEVDVVSGGKSWLHSGNLFVIEVHKEPCLGHLKSVFEEHGLSLVQVNQRPLPLLGRETRDQDNWWLVSKLEARGRRIKD